MSSIDSVLWSDRDIPEALALVAETLGLVSDRRTGLDGGSLSERADGLQIAANGVGLEAEGITTTLRALSRDLRSAAPALIARPGCTDVIVLLSATPFGARVLDRHGGERRVPWRTLEEWIAEPRVKGLAARFGPLLASLSVAERRRRRLFAEVDGAKPFRFGWLLRERSPGAVQLLNGSGLLTRTAALLIGHGLQFALFVAAWALLGRAALEGQPANSWLMLWALLFATVLTLRTLLFWQQGTLALGIGVQIKRKLLAAGLAQNVERLRALGSGNVLGRVLESDAFESLAINGGVGVMVAGVELLMAGGVIAATTGASWLLLAYGAVLIAVVCLTVIFFKGRMAWTQERLAVTGDLVERLLGRETRIVQQHPSFWHRGEDEALDRYHGASLRMDANAARLRVLPKTWLLLALPVLMLLDYAPGWPLWLLGAAVGAVLLVQQSLGQLVAGSGQLAQALVLWRVLRPLVANSEVPLPAQALLSPQRHQRLTANGVGFAYSAGRPVLRDLSVTFQSGQHVLLSGASGCGKSTLATLLAGQLRQQHGQILLNGLDQNAMGTAAWRQRVVAAPQFHHNYIFPDTLAFNLLLGRRWPASRQDIADAQEVCLELGLGELISRMPGGLNQIVGEGGWPLSHGEAARIHVARCILQNPAFVILDESLGPLDPRSFARVLECLRERVPSLILVAHG